MGVFWKPPCSDSAKTKYHMKWLLVIFFSECSLFYHGGPWGRMAVRAGHRGKHRGFLLRGGGSISAPAQPASPSCAAVSIQSVEGHKFWEHGSPSQCQSEQELLSGRRGSRWRGQDRAVCVQPQQAAARDCDHCTIALACSSWVVTLA